MKFKKLLLLFLIVLLGSTGSSYLPAQSQDGSLRLQRPVEDKPSSQREPLQAGINRSHILHEPAEESTAPPLDLKKAFPSEVTNRAPLTGAIQEVHKTPPVVTLSAGTGTMAPPSLYRGWLEKTHPQFALQTSTMPKDDLVIVFDKYDDTGRTLDSLGLQFTTVNKKQFDSYDLKEAKVLVVDCGPKNLSLAGLMKVQQFVANGGYLFTTDWMLDRIDQQIFPGFIAWNGAMNSQKMYDAEIVGVHPNLFKNVVSNAHWKMDIHCHLIRVLNKDAVKVLAVSRQLVLDDPDRQGILAVVFPFNRGYVMHMTAHFDRSQQFIGNYLADPAPIIGIGLRQAIAINFVVAGLTGQVPD